MEQSRLASTASRFYRGLYMAQLNQPRQIQYAAVSTGRTADPSIYSKERDRELKPAVPTGQPEEMKDKYEPETGKRFTESKSETETENRNISSKPPRPPYASSPRLESIGVNNPLDPHFHQKPEISTALEGTSCAGLDGTPLPKQQEKEVDNGYYRHHKASPLSEIEFADSRKPITRATDSIGGGGDIITWLPEQLDTAEESLERATRIWRENAMRGDPHSPHGRVLRLLRGEWF